MTSSIRRIDLQEALEDYHQKNHRRLNLSITSRCNNNSDNDDAIASNIPTADSPTFLSGWDETIADDDKDCSAYGEDGTEISLNQRSHSRATSLTPHAMAHKSWVFGIADDSHDQVDGTRYDNSNYSDHNSTNPPKDWKIRWKASLAPHRIHQLVSNPSGTVIAAITDNGTVSILRGNDGRVLATRRVVFADQKDSVPSSLLEMTPEASFITSNQQRDDKNSSSDTIREALLVQTPDQPTLLISNIQGDRLNDNNDTVVTEATKSMNLQVIQIPSIESFDIQCLRGYFYYPNTLPSHLNNEHDDDEVMHHTKIRLVLIHNDSTGEARLALAEYDLGNQSCCLVQKNLSLGSCWEIDSMIGLRLMALADLSVVALVAHPINQLNHQKVDHQQHSSSKIIWLDPDHDLDAKQALDVTDVVSIKGEYAFSSICRENDTTTNYLKTNYRSRVQALEFTYSCNCEETLAMVVGIEDTKSFDVQILQVPYTKSIKCNTFELGRAHLVYRMSMPFKDTTKQSICLCPIDKQIYGPYSFRSKTSQGWNRDEVIHVFQTKEIDGVDQEVSHCNDGSAIGAIRLLITKQKFNQARALVHDVGMEILLQDEYAQFHPSEIVLEKLRRSLFCNPGNNNPTASLEKSVSNNDWNESLTGLERSSGNEKGQRIVLAAADYLLHWTPTSDHKDDSNFHFKISFDQLDSYLSSFVHTLKNMSNDFLDQDVPLWISTSYKNKAHALEERMIAIQYLNNNFLNNANPKNDTALFPRNEVIETSILNPQYSSIYSMNNLFEIFVRDGYFTAAEKIWESAMRSKLTAETMVSSILQIPSTINPHKYVSLLDDIVLPSLSINHELIPSILNWSCQMADVFDDDDSLDRSIYLLETIERATRRLRLKIHSSFAHYSPFVDERNSGNLKGRLVTIKERGNNSNLSSSEFLSLDSSFGIEDQSVVSRQSGPTILELGRMKRGAARFGHTDSLRVATIDENEGNVEMKLESARWLMLARTLGLSRQLVNLRNFNDQGGAEFVSKELIRHYSSSATCHKERYDGLTTDVKIFCAKSRTGYDKALMTYTKELCEGKNASPQAIEEVASIARCCLSPTSKCQVTKVALQAALFCRFSPIWLASLSKDAIEWSSGDSSLRSELEEASRLLLIDCIIGRYCGNGAKELFHVDNPLHAANLLDFVSKHINHDSVLTDIRDLCEAFHHLSIEDGCSRLIQNAILKGSQSKAESFLLDLYEREILPAQNVFSRVICFCIDVIEDNSPSFGDVPNVKGNFQLSMRKEETKRVTLCAHALTKIALEYSGLIVVPGKNNTGFISANYNEIKLRNLLQDLEQLKALQQDHNIFISFADLNNPKVLIEISSKLLSNLAGLYTNGEFNAASTIAMQTRRACSTLARPPLLKESDLIFTSATPIVCQLALRTNGLEALDFLNDLQILEASQSNLASRCCIAVALSFCTKLSKKSELCLLSKMKSLIVASSLLQDYILIHCPSNIIGISIHLSQLCGIISQVLERVDEGVGEKIDLFRKTLLKRAAEKRWSFAPKNNVNKKVDVGQPLMISQPILHPSWYVGDGLLLPPQEALKKGIAYCKQSMGLQIMDNPSMGIHEFARSRGAHALALRILSHSTTIKICLPQSECSFQELIDFNQQIGVALVERYLGGGGNGITSGVVDSQMAVAFLLSISPKLAFKIFGSSLKTAINTRDFSRVVKLATIGKVSGSKDSIMSLSGTKIGNWTQQHKFVSQCDRLATKANWWIILEKYNVTFNPHDFDDEKEIKSLENSYTASMIPALILNVMSKKQNSQVDSVYKLVVKFAETFSLPKDLPACGFIEYLLSTSESDNDQCTRQKVLCLDDTVQKLLHYLDFSKRVEILRKCLMRFESQENCVDYELLSVICAFYQTEISMFLSRRLVDENESDDFYVEMEVVDRRRDALAILSSYFQGDKKNERPSFSKFFAPLNESINDNTNSKKESKKACSRVLGWEMAQKAGTFDPLDGLETALRHSCSSAITSALSPICLPLGVPRGYIRVRSLIARFQKSIAESASLPSFDDDVLPSLNQLRSPSDIAELAEWCSNQYGVDASNKFACLDCALSYAIKASTEIERIAGERKQDELNVRDGDNELLLAQTLTRVKRITAAKDLLANRLEITKILKLETKVRGLSKVLEKLNMKLETDVWNTAESFVPERFVEILFLEASSLVAESALCEDEALSIGHFKSISHLIHRVCNLISNKYSHVQTGYLARRLTRRWLFHGDAQVSETDKERNENMIPVISQVNDMIPDIQEEDTMNFKMDLSILKSDSLWGTDYSTSTINSNKDKEKLTSEEEPSSIQATSEREISEHASHRSSLRIAFVMAFADGYHRSLSDSLTGKENPENIKDISNRQSNPSKISRQGLLSKIKNTRINEQNDQQMLVQEHAKELIRIVFAKSTSTDGIMKGLNESFASSTSVTGSSTNRRMIETLTFAMRHRTLRVASILIPQEALEEVLNEDVFAANSSLNACSFGSFCAKELEEMHLPIPHSDLQQLSQIHFPSYARALWKHHRDIKGSKGRLLLLILELYLKETVSDNNFFISIMKEIDRLSLPRTLLNAFECIVRYMDKIGPNTITSFLEANVDLNKIMKSLLQRVYVDLKRNIESRLNEKREDVSGNRCAMITIARLGRIVVAFSSSSGGQHVLIGYNQEIINIFCAIASESDEREGLRAIMEHAIYQVDDNECRRDFFDKISAMPTTDTAGKKDL